MKTFLLVALISFGIAGCGQKEAEPPKKETNSSGNPLTAPVDYLGAVAKAKKSAEKSIEISALTQHIQMFHAQEGHFPATLNDLVTKGYLKSLPAPPYGMQYQYNPQAGELKIVPK